MKYQSELRYVDKLPLVTVGTDSGYYSANFSL